MLPIDEFEEYCEKTSENYLTSEDGAVVSYGLESNIAGYNRTAGTVSGSDNRYGAKISANTEVTFSAPDTALNGKMGKIVVECYAAEETNVTLGGTTLVHTGDLNPGTTSGSDNSWQKLSFLQSCITDGEYTLTADKDIQIVSIHYEAIETDEKANTVTANLTPVVSSSPQSSADGHLYFVGQTDTNTNMNWYAPEAVAGLAAYKTQERKDDSGATRENVYSRVAFKMDETYAASLRTAEKDEVGYEVTYFDAAEMKDKYLGVYMDWAGSDQETVNVQSSVYWIPLTGSDSWKTYRGAWDTYGGWFASWTTQVSRGNPNFEFWVAESNTGSGRDTTTVPAIVRSFTVMPIDEYMDSFATDGDAFIDASRGAVISGGMTSSLDGKYQGAGVYQHAGAFGADLAADTALTFTVDNMTGKNNSGTVTVKCYAEEDATVTLDGKTQTLTGGSWQEISFADVSLDAALSLTADKAISIASVKVKNAISAIQNKNDYQVRGYNVNVSIKDLTVEEGSKLLVALYDENNKFIGVKAVDIEDGVESYGARIDTSETAETAKVFLLNTQKLIPVCIQTELIVK